MDHGARLEAKFQQALTWSSLLRAILLAGIVATSPDSVAQADSRANESQRSASYAARELFERVLVPCCWTQTLDVHESELADQLRLEIASRLDAGESALTIEDDLAGRFGERVRAVPRGRDPRQGAAWFAMGGMALALVALFVTARSWISRGRARLLPLAADSLPVPTPDEDDLLEAELEQALRRLDAR